MRRGDDATISSPGCSARSQTATYSSPAAHWTTRAAGPVSQPGSCADSPLQARVTTAGTGPFAGIASGAAANQAIPGRRRASPVFAAGLRAAAEHASAFG